MPALSRIRAWLKGWRGPVLETPEQVRAALAEITRPATVPLPDGTYRVRAGVATLVQPRPPKPRPVFQAGDAVEVAAYADDSPKAKPDAWIPGVIVAAWPDGGRGYTVKFADGREPDTIDKISPHDVRKPRKARRK